MLELLKQTTTAIAAENWPAACELLQRLLFEGAPVSKLDAPTLHQALNSALTVLRFGDFQTRWELAKVMPRLGPQVVSPLAAMLKDDECDVEVQWFAARILGEFDAPEATIALVELLQTSEEEELTAIAAAALARVGSSAIQALTALLVRPELRSTIATALAQIHHPQAVEPLLDLAKDAEVSARAIALEALGRARDERVPPILIQALDDRSARVRKEAAIALGVRADLWQAWDVLDRLQPLLYDFNGEVCQQAAIAIGRMGTPAAIATLFKVLQSAATPTPLQLDLLRAIAWVETAENLQYLQRSLPFVSPSGTEEIIKLLGRVKSPSLESLAAQILLNFFRTQPQTTTPAKQALARAWGQLQVEESRSALLELQADPAETVRLHAIAALKHFPKASETGQTI